MLLATVFALAAAALHAGWNLRVKTSGDRFVALGGSSSRPAPCAPRALSSPGCRTRDAWPWLALSGCIHVAYVVCLARAYGAGDFSLAYPLARGGGAMVAAIGGVAFLDDRLTVLGYVAILVITGGLVSFVRPGTSWDSIRWALRGGGADRLLHARRRGGRPADRGGRLRARHVRGPPRSRCRPGASPPVTSPTSGGPGGLVASAPHQRPGRGGGLRAGALRRAVGAGRLRHRAARVVGRAGGRRRDGATSPRASAAPAWRRRRWSSPASSSSSSPAELAPSSLPAPARPPATGKADCLGVP